MTYKRRRSILEGILDLRMTYQGNLEIEGKVTVPDAAGNSTDSEEKCNWRP
jgi:hypothetical protein